MAEIGPSSARALAMAARIAAGSDASAENAAAATPLAFRAWAPVARRSSLRATRATAKPSASNVSATAVEMPGPKPTTTMVFDMGSPTPRLSEDDYSSRPRGSRATSAQHGGQGVAKPLESERLRDETIFGVASIDRGAVAGGEYERDAPRGKRIGD